MESQTAGKEGLRERKRRETLERITATALELFVADGYEATTLDAIASSSGIARRTFFHYFASKEDIILAWQNALPMRFRAALLLEATDQSPVEAVRKAHLALIAQFDAEQAKFVARIIGSSEHLRIANQAKYLGLEQAGFETLCEMWPQPERRAGLRMVAVASVGAMRVSIENWLATAEPCSLADCFRAAFDTMKAELSAPRTSLRNDK